MAAAPYETEGDHSKPSGSLILLTPSELTAFKNSIRVIYETCAKLSKSAEASSVAQPDGSSANALFDIIRMLAAELTSKMAPVEGASAIPGGAIPPPLLPITEDKAKPSELKTPDATTDSGLSEEEEDLSDGEDEEESSTSYSEEEEESDPETYESLSQDDEEGELGDESDD